jgi:hypothetical protein
MRFKLPESDADYPAMLLANYMFGGSVTARMPNRIRNREGLSYGASSRFTVPADGDSALFSGTVSCNPPAMRRSDPVRSTIWRSDCKPAGRTLVTDGPMLFLEVDGNKVIALIRKAQRYYLEIR